MVTIKEGMSLLSVQNIFNLEFPYLRLGFFRLTQGFNDDKIKVILKPDLLLRSKKNEKEITINAEMSVSEVEKLFADNFGVLVQVFRKSGRSWLETKLTDDWSLKKQNEEGCELSAII